MDAQPQYDPRKNKITIGLVKNLMITWFDCRNQNIKVKG
jgi:hypothetical protein